MVGQTKVFGGIDQSADKRRSAVTLAEQDAAFSHLEELVTKIPEIQAKDSMLQRAHEARRIIEVRDRTEAFRAEINHYQQTIDQALRAAKAAVEIDDADEEARCLATVRMYTELHYTRLAPLQRSENELRELLKTTELDEHTPLESYCLTNEEIIALQTELDSFQSDYQKTYSYCQQLEGLQPNE